jgi:hypothetical protein
MNGSVSKPEPRADDDLTPGQREWLRHSEMQWRKAHEVVRLHPHLDVSDVYHALRTLELPPPERLRRGLTRVRVRPHAR